ncbi:MAG: zinc-binding dehydrogenase [Longimicrobiales bacterium]|nr:zinc-binding dehydrogenase [Longimicrobiales bacterium]
MRAWMLRRTGPPEVLELTDVSAPAPGPGEVCVRVDAIGINYAEVLSRKGLYGWAPDRPYVPGMEATGVIVAVGPGVPETRMGESVLCGMKHGAYAERVVVPTARALPTLPGFSLAESAAFGVNFMTAWISLMEMARLRPEDRIGVTAAAGGVGTAAVQIAAAFGCYVVGMAGSAAKLERVSALGADATVDYLASTFPDELGQVTDNGRLDVVLEVVGGDVYQACLGHLDAFGRLVVAGYAGLDYRWWDPWSWWKAWRGAPRLDIREAAEASIGVSATHIGYLLPDEDRLARVWRDLTTFTVEHGLRPVVGRTYGFEELPDAHRFMESRQSVGKLVVLTGGPQEADPSGRGS